jgi:uncharacterized membrane protein YfcA
MITTLLLTIVAGVGAGMLGALLGLGGGLFLVPVLNLGLGLPFNIARTLSLITVIGTSASVSVRSSSRRLINRRLAVMLAVPSVFASLAATHVLRLGLVSDRAAKYVFGGTAIVAAMIMLSRLDKRNIQPKSEDDLGALGGHFHDDDTGEEVSYRVRRVPAAIASAFGAGVVSTFAGLGGGLLVVPSVNSWCGVPMRVAAATSAFLIGVTAFTPVVVNYRAGLLQSPELAAASLLGVLGGSHLGLKLSGRLPVRALKLTMAGILGLLGAEYLFFQ